MRISLDEEYRGPGQADPKKTKDERAAELRALLQTADGREIVEYYCGPD